MASGATLAYTGGTHNLNAGARLNGPGTVSLSSGTLCWNYSIGKPARRYSILVAETAH